MRVAILATHPVQYQAPLWRRLAAQPGLDVLVFYGTDLGARSYRDEGFGVEVRWDTPLTAGYAHTFLDRDAALQRISFWRPKTNGLGRRLDSFKPDVMLLTAYNSRFCLEALAAARRRGIPVVMRHEASDEAFARSPLKAHVRDLALRWLYRRVDRFAAIGTAARRHLLRLGVPPGRIDWAPYCVDTGLMERQAEEWWPRRAEVRRGLGVADSDTVLLFSGKLIEKKQPVMIVRALKALTEGRRRHVHLLVMGDGPLRETLAVEGQRVLGRRLHLVGFVNQTAMGRWYAAADCLVLPSRRGAGETWGLVVNEAMQFGLRVVASDGVGCAADLVEPCQTGIVCRCDTSSQLAEALARVADEGPLHEPDRIAARGACAPFTLEQAAGGLCQALRRAVA